MKVTLQEEIQDSKAVVIGVELLRDVNLWFGDSTEVGVISTDAVSLQTVVAVLTYNYSRRILQLLRFQFIITQITIFTLSLSNTNLPLH